ncbi:MAG: PhoU domain-containing protein [Candidatus Hodarchaeales archaeon]|jgi:phosphate uptake regulator
MEIRKIQVTGAGDTRIISLPKDWAARYQLDKGSNVVIKELGSGELLIYPTELPIEKRITHLKESAHVSRDVLAAYLLGSDVIIIESQKDSPLMNKSVIKDLSRQLIGLEILGETQERIELHFLIDSSSLPNPREYVHRCFSIANQMQSDAISAFLNDDITLAKEVIERDVEVNRLYFLIVRMLKIMVNDKREISYIKPTTCLDWRMVAAYGENLGDSSVDFARIVKKDNNMKVSLAKNLVTKIQHISDLTTTVLSNSIDCFFTQDVLAAEELKRRVDNKLKNLHNEIQDDISEYKKEVVSRLSSLMSFLSQLRETAIDIGDLVIANDSSFE